MSDESTAAASVPAAQPTGRLVGRVARLSKTRARGFGFILDVEGTEYFLHKANCKPQRIFEALAEGDAVSLHWMPTPKGPSAVDVRLATEQEKAWLTQALSQKEEHRGNQ